MKYLSHKSGFLLIFAFVFVVKCQEKGDEFNVNSPHCGLRNSQNKERRQDEFVGLGIVGGTFARPKDWPWMVFILGRGICAGTLINSKWVLTAAHCFTDDWRSPKDYDLLLGAHNVKHPETGSVFTTASKIIIHEAYNQKRHRNDLALVKLEDEMKYTDQIAPSCLAKPVDNFNFTLGWATGWGRTKSIDDPNGSISPVLMEVSLPITRNATCKMQFRDYDMSKNYCSIDRITKKDTCNGDSGGPLNVLINRKWYVVGVTSYGSRSCLDGGVYSKVSTFYDWIIEKIKKN